MPNNFTYKHVLLGILDFSDGKNHSSCCQQAGVPDSCLPLCWGAVMDKDHPVTKLCLSYTRMFITCFSLGQSMY